MSVTEIKIASIQDVEQVVLETQYDDKLMHYRSPALFRGLPNDTYTLQTSLYRENGCWTTSWSSDSFDGLELLTIDCTAFCNEWRGFYCNGST